MLKELMEIEKLLDKAIDIYNTLSDKTKSKVNEGHTEMYSLAHYLRWGLQAIQDNMEYFEESLINGGYANIKVGMNQIYYDKMASEFVVEQYECDGWEGGKNVPMYSVVDGF